MDSFSAIMLIIVIGVVAIMCAYSVFGDVDPKCPECSHKVSLHGMESGCTQCDCDLSIPEAFDVMEDL